ncbi:helix-turn-helix domain-containing protein [Stenotrophomonas nematodicola]|uniref:Helix-turn-helix domain-containing protein n=1 Tax=Stenotrophomonas nematodicola TaxID=2656746 RepID=A0ABW7D0B9_9GAMM
MSDGGKLLTLAQAAELSACSTKTLRRAIDAGKLTACRLGQGAKSDRIHPVDLDAWWAASRLEPMQFPSFPYAQAALDVLLVDASPHWPQRGLRRTKPCIQNRGGTFPPAWGRRAALSWLGIPISARGAFSEWLK